MIILLAIAGIFYLKNITKETPGEKTMKCIASKAVLYSSSTCGHCKTQKEILGNYFSLFKNIDCFYEIEKCNEADISSYPTWVIDGKQYTGVKSIQKLAELTWCKCSPDLINNATDGGTCNISESCINSLETQCSQ